MGLWGEGRSGGCGIQACWRAVHAVAVGVQWPACCTPLPPAWLPRAQGAGKLSVTNSKAVLESYVPRASLVPAALHFAECPYMWPFCRQPLYAGAMPVMFNATILNGLGLVGRLEAPPTWAPADAGGQLLDVQVRCGLGLGRN